MDGQQLKVFLLVEAWIQDICEVLWHGDQGVNVDQVFRTLEGLSNSNISLYSNSFFEKDYGYKSFNSLFYETREQLEENMELTAENLATRMFPLYFRL